MPCVWLQHNKSQLFMNVTIIDATKVTDLLSSNNGNDAPKAGQKPQMFKALVDTGAQSTMISKSAAKKIGLKPIGKVPIMGVGGVSNHNNYLFHVGFVMQVPDDGGANQNILQMHVLQAQIQGAEMDLVGAGFDVLLGMDVISTGSLAIEGSGTYSFSF